MNIVDLKSYKAEKDTKQTELVLLNGELNNLKKLRDEIDFNISIMQELIDIAIRKSWQRKDT
jgi:hypothetical protein|tara:strand:+ start:16096 stop:16281 length:186 start_codon:yes stop_codon:yes gene_type:complete